MANDSLFDSTEFDNTMKQLASLPSSVSDTAAARPSQQPKPAYSETLVRAFEPQGPTELPQQAPQMGFLEGAAHDIWTGMKGGVFSQAQGVDNLINIVSGRTGKDRTEVTEALLKNVLTAPTEQDIRAGLKSMVLRGMGSAIPIILEFAIGTKGVGLGLQALKVPTAIKLGGTAATQGARFMGAKTAAELGKQGVKGIVGLAAPAYFGAREGGTSLAESIVGEEPMGRAIPKAMARGAGGVALGTTLGLTQRLPLPIKAPVMGGAFATQAAVEGGTPEEIISSGIVGMGLTLPEVMGKGIKAVTRGRAPHEGPEPTKVKVINQNGEAVEVYPQAIEALRTILKGRKIENVNDLDFATLQRMVMQPPAQSILPGIKRENFPGGRAYEQWVESMGREGRSKIQTTGQVADTEVSAIATDQTVQKTQQEAVALGTDIKALKPKYDKALGIFQGLANNGLLEKDIDGSYLIPKDIFEATWKATNIPEFTAKQEPVLPNLANYILQNPDVKFKFAFPEPEKGILNKPLDATKYGIEDTKNIDVKLDEKGTIESIDVTKFGEVRPLDPAEQQKYMKTVESFQRTEMLPDDFDAGNIDPSTARGFLKGDLGPEELLASQKGITVPTVPTIPIGPVSSPFDAAGNRAKERIVSKVEPQKPTEVEEAKGIVYTKKEARPDLTALKKLTREITTLEEGIKKAKEKMGLLGPKKGAIGDLTSEKRIKFDSDRRSALATISNKRVELEATKSRLLGYLGLTGTTLPEGFNDAKLIEGVEWKITQERGKKIAKEVKPAEIAPVIPKINIEGEIKTSLDEMKALRQDFNRITKAIELSKTTLEDPTKIAMLVDRQKGIARHMGIIQQDLELLRQGKPIEGESHAAQLADLREATKENIKFRDENIAAKRKIIEFQAKKEVPTEEVGITYEEALKAAGGDEDVARAMMKPAFGKGTVGAAEMGPEGPKIEYAIKRPAVEVDRRELESKMREVGFRLTDEIKGVVLFEEAPRYSPKILKQKMASPEGQKWRKVRVDLSDGAWEIRNVANNTVLNSSSVSDAPANKLPELLRRAVRPASYQEKARMEVKGTTLLPKDAPPFKTAAQAQALAQNLRKKGKNATIVTVDIPKTGKGDRPTVGYYVEVVETGTAGEAALGKILEPGKGREITITVDTPNGPVSMKMKASPEDAAAIATALGGKIEGVAPAGIVVGEPFEKPGTPPPGSRRTVDTAEDMAEFLTPKSKMAEIPAERLDEIVDKALGGSSEKANRLRELDKVIKITNNKLEALLNEHRAITADQPSLPAGTAAKFQPRIDKLNRLISDALKEQGTYLETYRELSKTDFGGSAGIDIPRYEGDIDIVDPMGKPFKATILSEGYDKGSKYYVIQGADGMAPQAGKPGNVAAAKAWIREGTKDKKSVLILNGWTGESLPRDAQDILLNTILEKNMTGNDPRAVHKKSGVADDAWDRRRDVGYDDAYQARIRRAIALKDIKERIKGGTELGENLNEALARQAKVKRGLKKAPGDIGLLEEMLREETLVDSIKTMMAAEAERGPVTWTKEQRMRYLETALQLNDSIDHSLQDIDYARAGTGIPKVEDMCRIVDRFGDPSRAKHPTMRRIAGYGQQYELGYRKALMMYSRLLDQGIGYLVKDSPEKNKELMMHLHKVKVTNEMIKSYPDQKLGAEFVSKDEKIIQAAQFHKTVFEDLARRFELEKKGLYVPDYATIRYDMDKIWKFFGRRLAEADDYKQLPDSVLGSIRPSHWSDLKKLADRYIDVKWADIPKEDQTYLKTHYLKWGGAYAEWEFLPRDLQQTIPKEKWVENFQHRTAGDTLKFALVEDYWGTTMRYLNVAVRGAMYNEFLTKANPLLRTLPFKSQPGTWGKFAQDYVERLGGYGPESWSDLKWNSIANRLNQALGTSTIPMYLPKEVVGQYREMLYRGALGPDTALRNLTQTMFTWAEDGTLPVMKGIIKFTYGAITKTPEYLRYKETRDLLEENFYLEMQGLRKSDSAKWQKIKDMSHRLTWLVLSPLRITENINKGIAYFSGLEAAMKKGVDFRTAHLMGTRNASSFETTNLERTELEWNAWQKMGKSQFLYGPSTTSPYMQSNIAASFMPFMSFPAKSIQMFSNGLRESWMSKDWMRLARFTAVAGFMAAAPALLASTLGIDAFAVWGKGALPIDIMPMWYNTMRDIYTGSGGSDTDDFMSKELARKRVKESLLMLGLPQYRWLRKTGAPYAAGLTDIKGSWQRIDDKVTRWGRTESPLTDTTIFAEFMSVMGWPLADRREGRVWMREAKDVSAEYQYNKSKAIRRILDLRTEGRTQAANNAMKMATSQGMEITGENLSTAMRNRQIDAYTLQAKRMPKTMQQEWRKKAEEMKKRMIRRGDRPMWGGSREESEEEKE